MNWLQSFFNTPARQAMGWTGLGILGIVFAAIGVWFLSGDGSDGGGMVAASGGRTPTAAATATPSPTAARTAARTPSATATPSASPSATATGTTFPRQAGGGGGISSPAPQAQEPTSTPTATPPAVVASGDYCPNETTTNVNLVSRVAGLFTVGGAPGPSGRSVTLLFGGVPGPSGLTVSDQGRTGFGVTYGIGDASCANRPGAAISLLYEGGVYPTGLVVPPSNPGALQVANLEVP